MELSCWLFQVRVEEVCFTARSPECWSLSPAPPTRDICSRIASRQIQWKRHHSAVKAVGSECLPAIPSFWNVQEPQVRPEQPDTGQISGLEHPALRPHHSEPGHRLRKARRGLRALRHLLWAADSLQREAQVSFSHLALTFRFPPRQSCTVTQALLGRPKVLAPGFL